MEWSAAAPPMTPLGLSVAVSVACVAVYSVKLLGRQPPPPLPLPPSEFARSQVGGCLCLAGGYVASLYLWRGATVAARDEPETIKKRMLSVGAGAGSVLQAAAASTPGHHDNLLHTAIHFVCMQAMLESYLGLRVYGSGFKGSVSGCGFRVQNAGFRLTLPLHRRALARTVSLLSPVCIGMFTNSFPAFRDAPSASNLRAVVSDVATAIGMASPGTNL